MFAIRNRENYVKSVTASEFFNTSPNIDEAYQFATVNSALDAILRNPNITSEQYRSAHWRIVRLEKTALQAIEI